MDEFAFLVLGPLEVRYAGQPVPIRGARERAVLAALLLADGRTVPMTGLVEAIWDCQPPDGAGKAVRNVTGELRRRFAQVSGAGLIETSPAGYSLPLAGAYLDASDLERQVTAARALAEAGDLAAAAAALRHALGLWRGPALAGLGGQVLEAAAARLEEQRLTVVEDCLELELQLGRHRELAGELRALAAEWPLRERLARLLMLALYRSGRQAEALEAYHRLAQRLANDLGLDPSIEVARLHEAILRQDAALVAASAPADVSGGAGSATSVDSRPDGQTAACGQTTTGQTTTGRNHLPAARRRRLRTPRSLVLGCTLGAVLAITAVVVTETGGFGPSKAPAAVANRTPSATSRPPIAPEPQRRAGLLVMVPGQVADLDSMAPGWGIVKAPGSASDDIWFSITDDGLHGDRNANIAILPAGDIGTFNECAKDYNYGVTLDERRIRPGQLICDITNDNRVAVLRIIDVQYTASRTPDQITLDIVVWVPLHRT